MQLESVTLSEIGPFKDTVTIDLGEFGDAKLIAVTGENGAGKTSLLELATAGALYRKTPTQGTLVSRSRSRRSILESTIVNGARYKLRHVIDSQSGKSEAVVLNGDGAPLFDSSKVRDFDDWASKHLLPPEVLLNTMIAPQKSRGFLGESASERKKIILRARGIEHTEKVANCARLKAKEVAHLASTVDARLADERERLGISQEIIETWNQLHPDNPLSGLPLAKKLQEQAAQAVAVADDNLAQARVALDDARQQAVQCVARANADATIRAQRSRLQADIDQARSSVHDLDTRIANNRAVLANAEKIRAAVTALECARTQLTWNKNERTKLNAQRDALYQRQADLGKQYNAARLRLRAAEQRLAEGDAIRAAAKQLPELEAAAKRADDQVTGARRDLEQLQGQRIAGADERIGKLRGGLSDIAAAAHETAGEVLGEHACDTIAEDDQAVAQAASLPGRVEAGRVALAAFDRAAGQARRELDRVRATAGKLEALEQAQGDRDSAQAELDGLESAEAVEQQLRDVRAHITGLDETIAKTETNIADELEPVAKELGPLENAETRIAVLEPQRDDQQSRLTTLEKELADTPAPEPPSPAPDVSLFENAAQQAEQEAQTRRGELAVANKTLQDATASADRIADLETQRDHLRQELGDWTRLADDLGPNGLQLALIDSAGPEITATANSLLHECHGSRFSVRVETQRASADGKKMIDGCDVIVFDTRDGREDKGENFSGGEQVIVAEALGLALTVDACRVSGVESPTLIRDETGAALSPENGRAYIAMLRRAADMVGASRVLFVSHDPALQDMADGKLLVANGTVELVR